MKTKKVLPTCASLLIICCFISNFSFSQKFSAQIGMGLGSTLAKGDDANEKSRIKLQVNGYYNLSPRHAVGVEVSTSGSFINSAGGNINGDSDYDPVTNTKKLGSANMNATTLLSKYKYYFRNSKKGFNPFVEFGAGINTYYKKVFNINAQEMVKAKKNNFVFQPEAGFSAGHFQMSLGYLIGGSTPVFSGVDDLGVNLKLESIRISPLYLNASWRFDF